MSEYLQLSQPVKNPADGYYYQKYRFLDSFGNVTRYEEQPFKSWEPNSKLGLFNPALDGYKLSGFLAASGAALWGVITKNMTFASRSFAGAARMGVFLFRCDRVWSRSDRAGNEISQRNRPLDKFRHRRLLVEMEMAAFAGMRTILPPRVMQVIPDLLPVALGLKCSFQRCRRKAFRKLKAEASISCLSEGR